MLDEVCYVARSAGLQIFMKDDHEELTCSKALDQITRPLGYINLKFAVLGPVRCRYS